MAKANNAPKNLGNLATKAATAEVNNDEDFQTSGYQAAYEAVKDANTAVINGYKIGRTKNGKMFVTFQLDHPEHGNISARVYEKSIEATINFDDTGEPESVDLDTASLFKTGKGNWVIAEMGQGGDW